MRGTGFSICNRRAPIFPCLFLIRKSGVTLSTAALRPRWGLLLFRFLDDGRFGHQQQRRHRRGILQRNARHFGRIDDANLQQVAELLAIRIKI